jgi:hypothetical protein
VLRLRVLKWSCPAPAQYNFSFIVNFYSFHVKRSIHLLLMHRHASCVIAQLATFDVVATSFAFRVSIFRECAQAFMTDREDRASYGEAKRGKLWDKRGGNRHMQRCHVVYSGGY